MFDPEAFMNQTTDDATSTEYAPVPIGIYVASITGLEPKVTEGGSPYLAVMWKIDAPEDEDVNGKTVRQTIWLDLAANGAIISAKGKNLKLGYLREALHQNTPGVAWSPLMLVGGVARIEVSHRHDKDDPNKVYEDVRAVSAL